MKKVLFSLLAAVLLTACNHNNEDETKVFSDFATLVGVTNQSCSLDLMSPTDGSTVTLTANQSIQASTFQPGARVFINYSTPSNEAYKSGACTLYGMYNTQGGGMPVKLATAESTKDWESIEVQIQALSVTGNYINVVALSGFTITNYECNMYLDSNTVNDEYPTLHMVMLNKGVVEDYYTILGSWSIESIRGLDTCKGVKLIANDPNHKDEYIINFK